MEQVSSILENAPVNISKYNTDEFGQRWNSAANKIYKKCLLDKLDPFNTKFRPYILGGLKSFGMTRGGMMGRSPYNNFNSILDGKLQEIKPILSGLNNLVLTQANLQEISGNIVKVYEILSDRNSLNQNPDAYFHVGATKILHFLMPNLFMMVDSNASKAFKQAHGIPFKNSTQPGYSSDNYIKCMECAKKDISRYGVEKFQTLEPNTPLTRIYDKLAFIVGRNR